MRKIVIFFCFLGIIFAQPTITGVNAFWWLGGGILSDGGTCSGQPTGYCYCAQAAWTANANGATGTPTWHVIEVPGGGLVSLSCYTCTNTVATSENPSNGCNYDVKVYVTYPDGSSSGFFYVAIVTPSITTLIPPYPTDAPDENGYLSETGWNLTDTCGYSDAGLDGNETFGPLVPDATNQWAGPTAVPIYNPTSGWGDQIGHIGYAPPWPTNPQSPLTTIKIMHDYPWTLWVGSQASGSGVPVRSDTQQWYLDHGRHL
jgi:hypothetical protein